MVVKEVFKRLIKSCSKRPEWEFRKMTFLAVNRCVFSFRSSLRCQKTFFGLWSWIMSLVGYLSLQRLGTLVGKVQGFKGANDKEAVQSRLVLPNCPRKMMHPTTHVHVGPLIENPRSEFGCRQWRQVRVGETKLNLGCPRQSPHMLFFNYFWDNIISESLKLDKLLWHVFQFRSHFTGIVSTTRTQCAMFN